MEICVMDNILSAIKNIEIITFRPSKKNVLVLRQWISKKGQGR
jgi:hypothetical protein